MSFQYFDEGRIGVLVERLVELTRTHRLEWRAPKKNSAAAAPEAQFVFVSVTDSYGFRIASRDEDDFAPHILSVFNRGSDRVQEMQVIDSSELNPDVAMMLENLYRMVKRQTLKTDVVADQVLAELDRLADQPPF